jgi:hypothetical protein
MNAAEFSVHFFEQILDAGIFSNITNFGERAATEQFDFSRGCLYKFGAPAGRNNVGAGFGQRFGNSEPDAAGAADDNCIFLGEIEERMSHKGVDKVRENYTVKPGITDGDVLFVTRPGFFNRYRISPA